MRLLLLLFFSCLSTVIGLICYHAISDSKHYKPSNSDELTCPGNPTRCFKMVYDNKTDDAGHMVRYGCDGDGDFCTGVPLASCSHNSTTKICCCAYDLCNYTSAFNSMLVVIVFIMFSVAF